MTQFNTGYATIPYVRPVVTPPIYRRGDTWYLDFSTPWDGDICLAEARHIGFRSCDGLKLYSPSTGIVMLEAATGGGSEYVSLKASGIGGGDLPCELRVRPNNWSYLMDGSIRATWSLTGVTYEAGAVDVGEDWGTSGQYAIKVGANKEFTVAANTWTFGYGATADLVVNFSAATNSGTFMWNRANDRFKFGDDILLDGAERAYFGSGAAHYIEDLVGANTILNINSAASTNFSFAGTAAYNLTATVFGFSNNNAVDIGSAALAAKSIYAATSIQVKAGTSSTFAKMPGDIAIDLTQTGNVGTGVDTLQTYSVGANVLSTDEMYLEVEWFGTFGASAATKQIIGSYAGTTLLDTGAMAITAAHDWRLTAKIFRTGAATQIAIATFWCSDPAIKEMVKFSTPAGTLSGATTLLLTGTATNNNDIVKRGFHTRWGPNA